MMRPVCSNSWIWHTFTYLITAQQGGKSVIYICRHFILASRAKSLETTSSWSDRDRAEQAIEQERSTLLHRKSQFNWFPRAYLMPLFNKTEPATYHDRKNSVWNMSKRDCSKRPHSDFFKSQGMDVAFPGYGFFPTGENYTTISLSSVQTTFTLGYWSWPCEKGLCLCNN